MNLDELKKGTVQKPPLTEEEVKKRVYEVPINESKDTEAEREQFVLDFMDACINNGCDMVKIGRALYDAGYRKQNEVKAETAREIKNLVSLLPFIAEDGKELDVLTLYLNTMIISCGVE